MNETRRWWQLAWLLAGCGAGCAGPRTSSRGFTAADRGAVIDVLDAQREAWNRGDLAGYMAGYSRSSALIFTSGGAIRRGWQETHDKYLARYGGDRAGMGRLTFEVLEVQAVGGDGAVVLGRWGLTATPAAGGGVFTVVLERQPVGWRIVHDHTSSDPINPDAGVSSDAGALAPAPTASRSSR
jgi:ketosteroid isomerase-like protein